MEGRLRRRAIALLLPALLLVVGTACEDFVAPEILSTFQVETFDGTVLELEPPRVVSADGGIVVAGGFATECPAAETDLQGWLKGTGGSLTLEVVVLKLTRGETCVVSGPGDPAEIRLNMFTYRAQILDLEPGVHHLRVEYRGATDRLRVPDPPFEGHVRVR